MSSIELGSWLVTLHPMPPPAASVIAADDEESLRHHSKYTQAVASSMSTPAYIPCAL